MATRPKRPRDLNQLAALIVGISTGEVTETRSDIATPSHLGRRKGGHARAKNLTPRRRKQIAKAAAKARWKTIK